MDRRLKSPAAPPRVALASPPGVALGSPPGVALASRRCSYRGALASGQYLQRRSLGASAAAPAPLRCRLRQQPPPGEILSAPLENPASRPPNAARNDIPRRIDSIGFSDLAD